MMFSLWYLDILFLYHNWYERRFFMARHKVDICGVNTANIKVLSSDEIKELFIRYKNGDMNARDELVRGNLKLVLSILKKFYNKVDNLENDVYIHMILEQRIHYYELHILYHPRLNN